MPLLRWYRHHLTIPFHLQVHQCPLKLSSQTKRKIEAVLLVYGSGGYLEWWVANICIPNFSWSVSSRGYLHLQWSHLQRIRQRHVCFWQRQPATAKYTISRNLLQTNLYVRTRYSYNTIVYNWRRQSRNWLLQSFMPDMCAWLWGTVVIILT